MSYKDQFHKEQKLNSPSKLVTETMARILSLVLMMTQERNRNFADRVLLIYDVTAKLRACCCCMLDTVSSSCTSAKTVQQTHYSSFIY